MIRAPNGARKSGWQKRKSCARRRTIATRHHAPSQVTRSDFAPGCRRHSADCKQLVDEPVLRCDEIVNGQAAPPAVQARVAAQENLHPPTDFPAGGGFARLPGRRSLRGLRSLLPSAERRELPSRQVKRCPLLPTAADPRLRLGRYGRPAPVDRQAGSPGPPRLLAACAVRSRAAVAPRPTRPPPVPRAAARQGA